MTAVAAPPAARTADGHRDPQDWRSPVLAVLTWMGAWAGTSGAGWLLAGCLVAGLAVAGLGWRLRRWLVAAAAAVLVVAAGIGGLRVWVAGLGPVPEWARQEAVVVVEARVGSGQTSDAGRGGPVWSAYATLVGVEGRGEAWVSGATLRLIASGELAGAWAAVPTGATVRAAVRLSPAAVDEPVAALARARGSPDLVAAPSALDLAVSAVRNGLRESVSGLPAGPRALVPALVVGDTGLMTADLQADFRTTGLLHLAAVSGANLTLLLAAMLWVAARWGVTGWWRRGVAVVGVVAFVLLCRAEPSVLRAAAMGVVGLAALGWGGARQGLRYLSWAVMGLLLVDPWLCRSVGFVLSVCASGGIILWADRWAGLLAWAPRWLAEGVTVPIAAQLATQPVVTAISGQVSLVGVVANVLAAPLVGPATVLGFVAAGLSVVSLPVAGVAGWLAGGFAQALCWVAAACAALPGAAMVWPAGPVALLVLTACCLAVLLGLPHLLRRRWLVVAMVVAMVVVLARPVSSPGWPPEGWQVVSCDVGQGDATVIAAGQGRAIVVDAGPEPKLVDRCLDQLGVTEVAWLVLTHLHADHVGGTAGVASGRRVDNLLFSGVTAPESGWRLVQSALPGVPRTVATPGMVVVAGTVQLVVLAVRPFTATTDGDTGDNADVNDSSIVMRVTSGRLRIVLSGDVEEAGQDNAVNTSPDLSADVLLVPHHGSAHQSPAFLDAVHESVALVSVGLDNDYGHPAARTITTVEGTGARVYRTDRNGSIAVVRQDGQLVVTTERGG